MNPWGAAPFRAANTGQGFRSGSSGITAPLVGTVNSGLQVPRRWLFPNLIREWPAPFRSMDVSGAVTYAKVIACPIRARGKGPLIGFFGVIRSFGKATTKWI